MKPCEFGRAWFLASFLWSGPLMAQTNVFPSSGNVGIGTTNPQWALDVDAPAARIVSSNSNAAQFDLVDQGGGRDWAICSWGSAAGGGSLPGKFSIYDNTLGAHRLVIDSSGNMGIGTTAPQYALDVAGNLRLPNNNWILENDDHGNPHLIAGVYSNNVIGLGDIGNAFGSTTAFAANQGFIWYINGSQVATIGQSGYFGIGTANPTCPLSVNGTVQAKEVVVESGWSDYVFDPTYRLAPLTQVEAQIKAEGHLPGIPSAKEVAAHGVNLGDMEAKLLAKVEELTLRQIDEEKRIKALEDENRILRQENQH
jgi:hypothetical protein